MKRLTKPLYLFIALFLMNSATAFSQTLKEFFNSSETKAIYLGIDFTKAKLLGDNGAKPEELKDRNYPGINDKVANEPKKIAEAFKKSRLDSDISLVLERNKAVKPEEILSTNSADYHRFQETDISTIVKSFDFKGKTGMGILFIVEAMSKAEKAAAIWVTFVDMSTKKVLFTERLEGKAGGFGYTDYWSGPVRDILKTIDKKKYDEWKAKYGS